MRFSLRKFILIPVVLAGLAALVLPASTASASTKAGTITIAPPSQNWAGYYVTYYSSDTS